MIAKATQRRLQEAFEGRVRFGVPMSRYTALRVGGPADALAVPADRADLAKLLQICVELEVPYLVIGSGFNSLVRDGGIEGMVIHLRHFREIAEEKPRSLVRAEAGVSHNSLVKFCAERGLSGLEFGAGIPGTIGGWIAMNAGFDAREVALVVREVEVQRAGEENPEALHAEALRFVYRGAAGLPHGAVVLSALFEVGDSTPEHVRAEVARGVAKRTQSQPLHLPSCGSVFKNPPGDFAGRLIEAAGLKGVRLGGAEISSLHANFIVNAERASARDILSLIELAQERVWEKSGVRLEPEVRIVGRES